MIASEKPRSSITSPRKTYITPIRLWSTLVIHSLQRVGSQPFATMIARTATMTTMTDPAAAKGIG